MGKSAVSKAARFVKRYVSSYMKRIIKFFEEEEKKNPMQKECKEPTSLKELHKMKKEYQKNTKDYFDHFMVAAEESKYYAQDFFEYDTMQSMADAYGLQHQDILEAFDQIEFELSGAENEWN